MCSYFYVRILDIGADFANHILDKTNIFDRFPRTGVVVIDVERIYKLDNTLEAGIQIA